MVDAGYTLYQLYGQGNGVSRDVELAVGYLEESADMGFLLSQRTLAEDYFGRGDVDFLDADYRMARTWYTKAAEQEDRVSAIALAKIYHQGIGVEVDDEKAFYWVSRSESMKYGSFEDSIGPLAQFYGEGIGTEVDLVQAYKYRDLMGTAGASYKIELAKNMTPEQIDQAVRLSGEWQREHSISMPNSEGYHYR